MAMDDAKKLGQLLEELEPKAYDGISTGWQQIDGQGKIFASGTQIRFSEICRISDIAEGFMSSWFPQPAGS